ncbi:MAG: hypothetical protein KGM24_08040 [Elusimicrobia bacterium]|nr:hypothetical protein [Elusimicrobiota bacterium]
MTPNPRRLRRALAAVLLAAAVPASAVELGTPINGAVSANAKMLTNPPLPMIDYKPGAYKVAVEPDYFVGRIDGDNADSGSHDHADLKGAGGAVSASWAFADRWGVYAYGMGSAVDASNITKTPLAGSQHETAAFGNTHASFEALSVGIVRQFFGDGDDGFALPVFLGPMIAHVSMAPTHVVLDNYAGGVTQHDDYDVSVDQFLPGVMGGVESSFDVGRSFALQPFALVAVMAKQPAPNITNVRVQQSQDVPQTTITHGYGGFGLDAVYRPWGVSVNLTAPLFDHLVNINGATNFSGSLFSVSWAFGRYVR